MNTASISRLLVQYGFYLSRLVHGDLGRSIVTHEPVISEFGTLFRRRSSCRLARSCLLCALGCRPASSLRSGATPSSIMA